MAQPSPLEEASDPATDPERLRELADINEAVEVHRAAWRNPSLPEDEWRKVLMLGVPEAWANPMALFYLLTWTPRKDDPRSLVDAARSATQLLWDTPKRCSPEGKALLNAKVQEWWVTSEKATRMMIFLGAWINKRGVSEHFKVMRLLLRCVRTVPHLITEDHQALNILDEWIQGGADGRDEALGLAYSSAVEYIVSFALHPNYSPWKAINAMVITVASDKIGAERDEAKAEHNRMLADLIRQEMPLPPVVE